jgi:hypothetical protein
LSLLYVQTNDTWIQNIEKINSKIKNAIYKGQS